MVAIDQNVISASLARGDAATTTTERGDALEDLIVYLFELVPGIADTQRKARNPGNVGEIDVAFWNDAPDDGLRGFDTFVLVECKNWSTRVGYEEIVVFHDKLESRGRSFGIMVAASGVTGNAESRTAAHHALFGYLRTGLEIVVLTRCEIEHLATTDDLVKLLKRKRLALTLGGEIFVSSACEEP
ncbi:restriction endonuclease [Microbacterium sp. 1P10UB]|uniref:restriction endonuclease n=1 Tax=unclassified Microbacterium TaxID=2609290 RepID=UPI0039A0BBC6